MSPPRFPRQLGHGKPKEKVEMGRGQALQKKWFILVVVASRLAMMHRVLEASRKRTEIQTNMNHAARVIQRCYARYKDALLLEKKQAAMEVIAKAKAKKREETTPGEKLHPKIPDAIRKSIAFEDLIRRRREHRHLLGDYETRLAMHQARERLVPSLPDMLALIEKGFIESTSSGLGKL
ncbi:hypothetical protein BDK51DRAFT_25888 [Blyttiomyces helicus]|uniref:Uncharacterized protein n=1 Tax=Blyttiomyces helicus TaxID=388810 RepID=A0A4P9VVY8_9FUNG|nr:hypothetical protein BDK51DRAFT_25888 [Blyttiomyces helicus]|eukprot:RKO83844.1 hypothetical protein BDK51DRAFT_25888 [Blyttiomyces helicus]